jgi:tetratricopeptide (TPR) repeat protein
MIPSLKKSLPLIFLITLVAVVFWNSVPNGFVWDDNIYILNNPVYGNFDLTAMFTSLGNGLEYLPIRDMTYALDYALWGASPSGFHLSNVVYYGLNVIVVYLLASAIAAAAAGEGAPADGEKARATGFASALLFAVHPLHSEVASFLTCRNALLSTLFFFCSAVLYLRFLAEDAPRRRALGYGGALACFVLSLLSKANGIILPLVLVYLTLCVSRRRTWRDLLPTIPFLVLAGAAFRLFTSIASTAHIINDSSPYDSTLRIIAVKMLHIVSFYAVKFVAPFDLSADYYSGLDIYLTSRANIAVMAGTAIAVIAAVRYRRTLPYLQTGVAWYLITLIPVLNILPTTPLVADRYAFLPSFAFTFLIAAAVVDFCWNSRRLRFAGWAGVALLTCWWGFLAVSQNAVWRSEETLWEHTVLVSPESVKARTNLGRIMLRKGNFERAFALFDSARHINFNDPHYDFFEGISYLDRGETAQARSSFDRALQRDPRFIEALAQMGMLLEKQGEIVEAAVFYKRVLNSPEPDVGQFKEAARERLARMSPPGQK